MEDKFEVFSTSKENIQLFIGKILKGLNKHLPTMEEYGQLDNYSVILHRLKESEQFLTSVPKKALKKIDKTIEEIKTKLAVIRKSKVINSKQRKHQSSKQKQMQKIKDRMERRKAEAFEERRNSETAKQILSEDKTPSTSQFENTKNSEISRVAAASPPKVHK